MTATKQMTTPKTKANLDLSFLDRIEDPKTRATVRKQFLGWCLIYLRHYFSLPPAEFHPRLVKELTDETVEYLLAIGFRGSAKSVFCSLAFPMWCALENQYQFIILLSDTTTQMKMNISNIRKELEENELLIRDYGVMYDPAKDWSDSSLLLTNDVLILGRSRGQKVRGLRHREFRPQVIIGDDLEDLKWVRFKKNRDATETWFNSEVIPAQQETGAKLVVVGNLLHKNALMYRLKRRKSSNGKPMFKCLQFPLIKKGRITWRGKYPTMAAVNRQKDKVGSASAWAREYLLKIVAEENQIIKDSDIHRYDVKILTHKNDRGIPDIRVRDAGAGMDLAISEEETADFTTIVGGLRVIWKNPDMPVILVLPRPVNKHMDFDATQKEAMIYKDRLPFGAKWYVEDVNYQKAALQNLKKKGLSVYPMRPITDKRARLQSVAPFIKDGTVLFPESGCEELLEQLLGFGSEEHDDLVDALVYLILGLINKKRSKGGAKADKI